MNEAETRAAHIDRVRSSVACWRSMRARTVVRSVVITFALGACGATAQERDWAFMRDVGGVRAGQASRRGGRVRLALECDVSGRTTITRQPRTMNSGIAVYDIQAVRDGDSIHVWVRTGLADGTRGPTCGVADLGEIPGGKYRVYYGRPARWYQGRATSPIGLGEVDVEP